MNNEIVLIKQAINLLPTEEVCQLAIAGAERANLLIASTTNIHEATNLRDDISTTKYHVSKKLKRTIGDLQFAFNAVFEWCIAFLEASAKVGELIAEGQEQGEIAKEGQYDRGKGNIVLPMLRDIGIDKMQSSRWQRIAKVHSEDRRTYYEECKNDDKFPTLGGLLHLWAKLNPEEAQKFMSWLRVFNVWSFAEPDPRFGMIHPGRIPGQVNMNLNFYLTSPGDLIIDLFAGGGTTLDVCKYDSPYFGQRRCLVYDIAPRRDDIRKWDLVSKGLPEFKNAKLIFLDPPYWRQKRGDYSDDPTNLANMELDQFHDELSKIVIASKGQSEYVALIIGSSEFLGKEKRGQDHALQIVSRVGEPSQRIIVPYTTQQYQPYDVSRAKEEKTMLNLYRDLMIWRNIDATMA